MERRKWILAVMLLACALLCGCAVTNAQPEDVFQADLSVDINVPFATSTPAPGPTIEAGRNPISISSEGEVTIIDPSWADSGYASVSEYASDMYYTQLRLGDTGVEVRKLQTRLKELNYFTGDVSGVFDSATETAVELFELTYGTMQTGIATSKMQTYLYLIDAPVYLSEEYQRAKSQYFVTLQYGDVGSNVLSLQTRLKELGYPIMELTGVFDDATATAVRLFYLEYGLGANEVAIVALQEELYSETARKYSRAEEVQIAAKAADLTTLSEGNIGSRVSEMQQRLIELGYLTGEPSGTFDAATTQAVRDFQAAIGLEQTGAANAALQGYILSPDAPSAGESASFEYAYKTLREGDSGLDIANLQERLVKLGYANGAPNGKYGGATITAVKLFQKTAGLPETGIADAEMQALLYSDNAPLFGEVSSANEIYPRDIPMSDIDSGAEGELVTYLQRRLQQLKYFNGSIDGEYDTETASAVALFESALGLKPTGVASVGLQCYLYSEAAPQNGISLYNDDKQREFSQLDVGDEGDDVTKLQRRLWELGYLLKDNIASSVGTYNNATQLAVAKAQLAMGYKDADGTASAEFQAFLYSSYGDYIKK